MTFKFKQIFHRTRSLIPNQEWFRDPIEKQSPINDDFLIHFLGRWLPQPEGLTIRFASARIYVSNFSLSLSFDFFGWESWWKLLLVLASVRSYRIGGGRSFLFNLAQNIYLWKFKCLARLLPPTVGRKWFICANFCSDILGVAFRRV